MNTRLVRPRALAESGSAVRRGAATGWIAVAVAALAACAGPMQVEERPGVAVSPPAISVAPGDSRTFTCTIPGARDAGCDWSVLEGQAGGSVTSAGLYTAPASAGTYHVVATVRGASAASASATVIVERGTSSGADGSSSGGGAASSSGGAASSSSSGAASSSSGAASSGSSSGTSNGGTGSSGGTPIAVTVSPRTASVAAGGAVQLSASVTGTSNTTVSWTVAEGAAGGAVTVDGRYTAPSAKGVYRVVATSQADPSAKDTATITVTDPVGTEGDGDFTVSSFPTQPELTDRGAPRGKRFTFTMDSTKSTIFDGSDKTLDRSKQRLLTRQITVYVPAKYVDGTPAPILIIQDGPGPIDQIGFALDNMTIATDPARKIPPFIAIGVQNGGSDSFGSERGLEYDTLSDRYARFIDLEVLPAVLANAQIKAAYPHLAFTTDPEGRATYGCSSGAAAAFTMAWFAPDRYRRVLSYSGTLVAQQNSGQPESTLYPLGAWEYHSSKKLIAEAPVKPLRIFLNVNEKDLGSGDQESTHHNWVMANQRTAAALAAKGYHYRYAFATGLGHCDGKAVQATLADALAWLWRGYQ